VCILVASRLFRIFQNLYLNARNDGASRYSNANIWYSNANIWYSNANIWQRHRMRISNSAIVARMEVSSSAIAPYRLVAGIGLTSSALLLLSENPFWEVILGSHSQKSFSEGILRSQPERRNARLDTPRQPRCGHHANFWERNSHTEVDFSGFYLYHSSICKYICVCIYIYVCVYIYVCIYICIHIYVERLSQKSVLWRSQKWARYEWSKVRSDWLLRK